MSDDAPLRAALRRALQLSPSPGLTDRLAEHARRVARGEVEAPPSRVPVRTVAATLALTAAFAVGGVVVMQHRTASRLSPPPSSANNQPAVNAASPSSDLSQPTALPPASATPAGPSAAASSAPTGSASASAPVADCQSGDLSGAVDTGSQSAFASGSDVPVHGVVTNRSARPCALPPACDWEFRAFDSSGHLVGRSPATASCPILPPEVLQPGASKHYQSDWSTDRIAAGTYTIRADLNGLAVASTTVTIAGAPSTPTPAQATSTAAPPTPTPLVP
jgi:hypothetical protein